MAYQSFKDAGGTTQYRKVTGAGTTGDPAACHQIIDSGSVDAAQSGTWNITNVSGTISLPTGAATAANQSTILTSVQLLDDVVLAEDAAHSSGDKGVMALAVRHDAGGTLAGTTGDYAPLQVDSNGALRVTGGGGGTEYTEDAAAASDPVGGASILVRADTPATITSTDGDNVAQRGTNYGAAFCQLVTSSGAFIDSVGGGTQYAVDAALGSTPTGTLAVAIRDDALSTLTPVEGDAIGLRVDANGALWTTVSGTVTVGTHAVTQSGTWNVTNISGTVSLPTGAATAANQSTIIGHVDGIETTLTSVDGKITACNTGAVVISSGTVTTLTTLTGGGIAHDSADSGNPHKIGAKAVASISGVTLVAAADRTDLYAGLDGVQITRPHCNLEDIVSGNATNTDGTSTQCIAAGGAGIKHYITSVVLCNTSASNITVDIKDGTTVKVSIPVPANSGAIFNPPVPIPGTAATAWNFDPSAAATTVTCSMIGFKSKI